MSRYKNLKEVNKNLVKEKAKIGQDAEKLAAEEKEQWNDLKKQLFEEQRKQQQIQAENEAINRQIQVLEQDFEIEIYKKNQNSRDIG